MARKNKILRLKFILFGVCFFILCCSKKQENTQADLEYEKAEISKKNIDWEDIRSKCRYLNPDSFSAEKAHIIVSKITFENYVIDLSKEYHKVSFEEMLALGLITKKDSLTHVYYESQPEFYYSYSKIGSLNMLVLLRMGVPGTELEFHIFDVEDNLVVSTHTIVCFEGGEGNQSWYRRGFIDKKNNTIFLTQVYYQVDYLNGEVIPRKNSMSVAYKFVAKINPNGQIDVNDIK